MTHKIIYCIKDNGKNRISSLTRTWLNIPERHCICPMLFNNFSYDEMVECDNKRKPLRGNVFFTGTHGRLHANCKNKNPFLRDIKQSTEYDEATTSDAQPRKIDWMMMMMMTMMIMMMKMMMMEALWRMIVPVKWVVNASGNGIVLETISTYG